MSNFVCWWVIFFLGWVIFFVAFGEKKIISQEKKLSPKTKLSSNGNTNLFNVFIEFVSYILWDFLVLGGSPVSLHILQE